MNRQEYTLGFDISKEMLEDDKYIIYEMSEVLRNSFKYWAILEDYGFEEEDSIYDPDEEDFII